MPEPTPQPFDITQFARDVARDSEETTLMVDAAWDRIARLEEIAAARWPRRWLLRRRLAREVRASVAACDPGCGDFTARRYQACSCALSATAPETTPAARPGA